MKILKISWLCLLLSFLSILNLKAQTQFNNLDELLNYAKKKSINVQSNDIKLLQAKEGKLAALLSIPDATGNLALSYTDNTRLPVSLFPAEAFGGAAGTFREVSLGVRYNTAFNTKYLSYISLNDLLVLTCVLYLSTWAKHALLH